MWGLPLFDVLDIINKSFWWISKTVLDIFAFQGSSLPWGIFPDTDAQLSVLDWSSQFIIFISLAQFQKTQKGIFTRSERFYLKLSVGRSVLRWHPVICSWLMPFCQFLHHQPFNHPLVLIGANAQIKVCMIEMSFILSSWHISDHNPGAIIWGLHVGNKVSFGLIWCPGDKSL